MATLGAFRKGHTTRGHSPGNRFPRDPDGRLAPDREAQKISRALLKRPAFLAKFQEKWDELTLHPSIVTTVMYYAWGRPTELVTVQPLIPVRIAHHYADDAPALPPADDDEDPTAH